MLPQIPASDWEPGVKSGPSAAEFPLTVTSLTLRQVVSTLYQTPARKTQWPVWEFHGVRIFLGGRAGGS